MEKGKPRAIPDEVSPPSGDTNLSQFLSIIYGRAPDPLGRFVEGWGTLALGDFPQPCVISITPASDDCRGYCCRFPHLP
jgi:hypothetical protein